MTDLKLFPLDRIAEDVCNCRSLDKYGEPDEVRAYALALALEDRTIRSRFMQLLADLIEENRAAEAGA